MDPSPSLPPQEATGRPPGKGRPSQRSPAGVAPFDAFLKAQAPPRNQPSSRAQPPGLIDGPGADATPRSDPSSTAARAERTIPVPSGTPFELREAAPRFIGGAIEEAGEGAPEPADAHPFGADSAGAAQAGSDPLSEHPLSPVLAGQAAAPSPDPDGAPPAHASAPRPSPAGQALPSRGPAVAQESAAPAQESAAPAQSAIFAPESPALPPQGPGPPPSEPQAEELPPARLDAGPASSELAPRAAAAPERTEAPPQALAREAAAEAKLGADVLRQVQVALDPGRRSATLRLDPRELGRITIRLEVEDGHVRAVLRAESPRALELLERYLPELRASFGHYGLEADELDLGLLPERDPRGGRADSGRDGPAQELPAQGGEPTDPTDSPSASRSPVLILGPGLDTYA